MHEVQQVLVAYDRSEMSHEALKRAISVAKKKEAQLIVVHVIEPLFVQSPFAKSVDEDAIKRDITKQIDQLNAEAQVEYLLFVESGEAAGVITLTAQKTQADLLVVGSNSKEDVESEHFGSTTVKIIQHTHIPVLIVKNRTQTIYKHMLSPTNLSEHSKESILFANTLFTKPTRKYLYAFETVDNLQAMTYQFSDEEAAGLKELRTSNAKIALETFVNEVGGGEMALIEYKASINEDLLDYIKRENADLLVLGSKGVGNLNSFVFGSTASYLVQRSPIDVLVYVPSST